MPEQTSTPEPRYEAKKLGRLSLVDASVSINNIVDPSAGGAKINNNMSNKDRTNGNRTNLSRTKNNDNNVQGANSTEERRKPIKERATVFRSQTLP